MAEKMNPGADVGNHRVFMAICETCGHDRRGNIIESDDVSLVSGKYNKFAREGTI
jgi:type I restriction enzyme M protein